MSLLKWYVGVTPMTKLLWSLCLGVLLGLGCWWIQLEYSWAAPGIQSVLAEVVSPLGNLFIQMLKMVVVPIVFFTILQGTFQLPLKELGNVGFRLIALYILSSGLAAAVGVAFAVFTDPGAGQVEIWQQIGFKATAQSGMSAAPQSVSRSGLWEVVLSMFSNPFEALSNSNFLGMIVFAMSFGLALGAVRDGSLQDSRISEGLRVLQSVIDAVNMALHKMVHWIMEYAPLGVFALTLVNFSLYGPAIVGPYLKVVGGVICAILFMIFVVYGFFVHFVARCSVVTFFKAVRKPMLTAFVTRSSAAALPISMEAAVEGLGVSREVASFALPMGATINMDGVCVHLPMFAILAVNIFGISIGTWDLALLLVSTVLAAVGTGGIPGGSLMLLFIILGALGLDEQQTAVVVSLALGVNPIIDMFETMNNVAGDLLCTYLVGRRTT
ncbi:MAG: dicarboxylate/amino acid:cation symporter [Zetaproteobacteria bacterium]|nr:dicarboxylate/amino acid:cation symporter [Zetaproteobacteria bacterium]